MLYPFSARRAPAVIVSTFIIAAIAPRVGACDLCSSPTAPDGGSGLSLGVFEQYSSFGTLRQDGGRVANDVDQWMRSSVTQAVAAYRFDAVYAVQIVVPYIHRAFRRPEGFAIDQGVEQGLGDISLLSSMRVLQLGDGESFLRLDDIGGIKLPTGRSARLGEEANEVEIPGAPESGVHGHDLALGSGSWDFIIGEEATARLGRAYLLARAQYVIRTRGTHDYQYANDLTWSVAPGVDLLRSEGGRLGLEAALTGEGKGKDTSGGEIAGDTGMVAIYLGPQLSAAWRRQLLAQAGFDLPLLQHDTALQLVPDYKLHAGLIWHF